MNKQNFEAQDRFPLSTQSLTFMQDMIMATARLALIGGDNYILSGCETQGNTVTGGVIVINGEIMPFEGGTIVETITIVEETIPVSANGLTFENARVRRYARFATGTGANYYPWANFKPLQTNKQLEEAKATVKYVDDAIAGIQAGSIPTGVIVMWGGSEASIPQGWVLCDGREIAPQVFVPNLSGKFIVGFNRVDEDYDTIGKVGGQKKVSLQPEEIPRHQHTVGRTDNGDDGRGGSKDTYVVNYDDTSSNTTIFTSFYGGNKDKKTDPHENRPPYYVLAFIIKIDIKG